MNSYSQILSTSLSEIKDFENSEPGNLLNPSLYLAIEANIQRAIKANSDEEAEEYLGKLLYIITDSGPINIELSKSLSAAFDSLQAKKKRSK